MNKKTVNKSKKKLQDPCLEREQQKYADPVASRELIMQVLETFGKPMTMNQLLEALNVRKASKIDALGYRLKAMLRDGQIMQDRRGRFCLFQKINLKRGTVQGHSEGFGFFIPEDGSDDMVLSAKEMRAVMHGDVVLAYQLGIDRRGRPEGRIHEVIEHVHEKIAGRFFTEQGISFVLPDNKRLTQDISIPDEFKMDAKNGQFVLVEILVWPNKRAKAIGKVVQVIGDHMAPGMEIEVAIHAHGIPDAWPADVLKAMTAIPQTVSAKDCKGRTDLRALPFVTIDGADARDFDDAVYCQKKPKGGFQLYVAIADVSHYVPVNSPLDKEAARRGNSVYFPERVIPMLPEALSNGICSLNPKVDRLCMVCDMSISAEGKINRSRFYRAVIHSKARLTYTQAASWLENGEEEAQDKELFAAVTSLYDLFNTLLATRKIRGAMDFETTETSIEFDENRKIKRIVPVFRNDAHKLIEECMLAANVSTAKFLEKAGIPALYRVHAAPEPEKIILLRQFLSEFGLQLGGGKKPKPKDFQAVLSLLEDRPEKQLIEMVVLRSLKQAQYLEANDGHFGLAYSAYTHFTSPIRRYPDLLIHRAIGHLLDNHTTETFNYTHEDMNKFGKHCSVTERRADEATRDVVSWLKCEYMQDKLGQVFKGRITAVTGFGIFVELETVFVEGLVHVTALKNDYYRFDATRHRLIGERSGTTYELGDHLTVQVARVDLDERKIDFYPVSDEDVDD